MMIFTTERLVVRQLKNEDLEAFHEMQGNPRVMIYTTGRPNSLEEDKRELSDLIHKYSAVDNNFFVWAIEKKEDKEFIGTVALIVNEFKQHELGFRLLERMWGYGYGSEVCNGLIEHWLKNMEGDSLYAYVDVNNTGSIAVLNQSILSFIKETKNDALNCKERVYRLNRK